jgi:Cu2+-exporting ATPase
MLAKLGEAECLGIAAALEQGSMHPIAKALSIADAPVPAARDSKHYAGLGVEAELDGHIYRLGRPEFVMAAHGKPAEFPYPVLPPGSSIAVLGDESRCLALFVLGDELRPDANDFVGSLHRAGKRVHLLSGDRTETVDWIAATLGIDTVAANAEPKAKLEYVQALQRQGRVVAMIGDGVNDAPVIAQASVSIAMGDGAWMSQRQADAVLLSGRLVDLRAAFETSARTLSIIRENLFWALAYNLTAVPLAALGLVTPWMAGIGMSASSLIVILNSLRLFPLRGLPAAASLPLVPAPAG